METVKIEIPGHKKFAKLSFDMKTTWPELNAEDMPFAAELVFANLDEQPLALGKAFTQLVQLPKETLKELGELLMGEDDGVDGMIAMYQKVDFIMVERPVFYESKFLNYKDYAGPADGLENITWYQFARAEMHFHLFFDDGLLDDLEMCLSYLYCKETFVASKAPIMRKIVKDWPLAMKQALFINYMGLRNFVLDVPALPEPPKDEEERSPLEALKADLNANSKYRDALDLPVKLAGEKFGTVQDINAMLVPDVLELMDQLKEVEK